MRVKRAYDTLSDATLRAEYDARWQQRELAQRWPVHDTLRFPGEFSEEECDDVAEDGAACCYTADCRCGGEFLLTEKDVHFRMDYVNCSTCSLYVRVTYHDRSAS